jgi:hypothetical protein
MHVCIDLASDGFAVNFDRKDCQMRRRRSDHDAGASNEA